MNWQTTIPDFSPLTLLRSETAPVEGGVNYSLKLTVANNQKERNFCYIV
jgi:hypothetical protein